MKPPPSLALRLLLAQAPPLAVLAAALAIAGAAVSARVVERSSDRLLAGSVMAIAERVSAEGGMATVDISPWSLGLLDGPERDAVFYSVRQGSRLVTGYAALERLPAAQAEDIVFADRTFRGMPVRVAETVLEVPGVAQPVSVVVAQSRDSRKANMRELLVGLIALPVFLVAGAALLVWPAVLWGLRPVRRLAAELADQSAQRRASYAPASLDGVPLELAPLVRAHNTLLASLERSASRLEAFAADASHQLRTPLTVITSNLALLARGGLDDAEGAHLLDDSRQASARLHAVLRQLLALARAEAAVGQGSADLGQAVRGALAEVARAQPQASLKARGPSASLTARGDSVLIEEMIRNLVANAAAYGDGAVVLLGRDGDGRPVVMVWDRGPGLDDAELGRLAERFFRGDRARGTTGAGLGMAIVRTIAEAFDVGLDVRNRPRRKGLVVRLTFQPA